METIYDVVIVGGGPAGLTAALYLARAKYRVVVVEKEQFGGQIAITEEVVNYPGIAHTSGKELTDTMKAQAEHFGAEFRLAEVIGLEWAEDIKTVRTDRGALRGYGVLLATGAHPKRVGFRGEDVYQGRGVAYCATCDGEFFTGKDVFVVGGGYAAAEESVFLTKYARHVTILVRKGDFSCPSTVAEKAKNHEKITVLYNTVLEEVSGHEGLTYARYRNTVTGDVTEYKSKDGESLGVFVFAGYAPATEMLPDSIACNKQGYLITDRTGRTSVEGIYGAGDVCIKPLRQVVTATGDGALAAAELERYVSQCHREAGNQPPQKTETKQHDRKTIFSADVKMQLEDLFSKMKDPLVLRLHLDERTVSDELEQFITALVQMTEKMTMETVEHHAASQEAPWVRICRRDGTDTGIGFHGVPGGHEFTSFMLGLYHAAGAQKLDPETKNRICAIKKPVHFKILVTLSCSMCPGLVTAAQQIALENPNITAQVYDIRHFEQLRERYRVMSVPCLVINDEQVSFGKKNIHQVLDLIQEL